MRGRVCVVAIACALASALPSGAQQVASSNASAATAHADQTQIDLAQMTPEQLQDADVMEVSAATERYAVQQHSCIDGEVNMCELRSYTSFLIRHALVSLYYPVDLTDLSDPRADARLREQVAAFQRTLGDAPTGALTMKEFNRLLQLERLTNVTPLALPSSGPPRIDGNLAYASGVWVIQHDENAFPLNFSEITCDRGSGVCTEREVLIVTGPSLQDAAPHLDWYQTEDIGASSDYEITGWSNGIIEARSEPNPNACRSTTLTLNIATGVVSEVDQDLARPCTLPLSGRTLPRMATPRVSILERSQQVAATYFAGIWAEVERHQGSLAATMYHRPYVPDWGPRTRPSHQNANALGMQ